VTLATATATLAIATDGVNVYWTNEPGGTIQKCAVGGCGGNPTTLASNQGSTGFIAVDAGYVYWTWINNMTFSDGGVRRCAVAGCGGNPTSLVTTTGSFSSIAVDGTSAYWNVPSGAKAGVYKCAVAGCSNTPTVIASGFFPAGIAVDATNVSWAVDGKNIQTCPINGCNNMPTTLTGTSGIGPYQLQSDGTSLYWSNGTISKCALTGGMTTILATNQGGLGIALDATNIYWATGVIGKVMKCGLNGCGGQPTVLASGLQAPAVIAVDGKNVYWTDLNDHTVKKIAK
jgi:hypothetical protein